MDDPISKYIQSKNVHYRIWELKEGGWTYFLSYPKDVWEPYHYGNHDTEAECLNEIKWIVGHYLDRQKE